MEQPGDKALQRQGEDFLPLRELLPLAAPLAMSIDTSEACNFRCRFCVYSQSRQAGLIKRPPSASGPFMAMAVFEKLVDDLRAFPAKVKKISVHCRGEPLLNRNIAAMIRLLHDANVTECIKISTNGSLLTRELARAILEAGIGQVVFSVEHVTDQGYYDVTGGAWGDYGKIIDNFRILREERDRGGFKGVNLCAKILDFITPEEQNAFRRDFEPIADTLFVTGLYSSSRPDLLDSTMGLGQSAGFYKTGLKTDRKVCPEPFFFLCVDVRGDVMPCWMDWSNGLVVGNLMATSLREIWTGEELRAVRRGHLCGERKSIETCENCEFIYGVHPQSDIDSDAQRLLAVYSGEKGSHGIGL